MTRHGRQNLLMLCDLDSIVSERDSVCVCGVCVYVGGGGGALLLTTCLLCVCAYAPADSNNDSCVL